MNFFELPFLKIVKVELVLVQIVYFYRQTYYEKKHTHEEINRNIFINSICNDSGKRAGN